MAYRRCTLADQRASVLRYTRIACVVSSFFKLTLTFSELNAMLCSSLYLSLLFPRLCVVFTTAQQLLHQQVIQTKNQINVKVNVINGHKLNQ